MDFHLPFLLLPSAKDYLWGGSRLNDDFGKKIDMTPLAETWECSTHPDGQSLVAATGEPLGELLKRHPEYLGSHPLHTTGGEPVLPILVKLIDARLDLSVQVHPDDAYALAHEGDLGKTEMWYVLAAKPGAELVYGFNQDVTAEFVRMAAADGSIFDYLNHVPVHKDDLFYVEPGTVHAIGAGVLIAEIQESSNVTYRLYDYGRVDKNGEARPLHIDKALEVMNLRSSAAPRQPMRVLRYRGGCASELLTRCKYFQVERLLLNTEVHRELTAFQTASNSFHVLLCTDGCGSICWDNDADGQCSSSGSRADTHISRADSSDSRIDFLNSRATMLNFFKGDCIFVPANSVPLRLHGKAQLLNVSC